MLRFLPTLLLAGCVAQAYIVPSQDEIVSECETICNERSVLADEHAWCEMEWGAATEDCATECAVSRRSSQDYAAAFDACALAEALCYTSLSDCLVSELHSGPTVHEIGLTGSGFADWEGATVLLVDNFQWRSGDPRLQSTTISGGALSHAWTTDPTVVVWRAMWIRALIDVDADGRCTPGVDLMGTATPRLVDPVTPRWEGSLVADGFKAVESCANFEG